MIVRMLLGNRNYTKVNIPDSWSICTEQAPKNTEMTCVNCGKPLTTSEGVLSKRYFTNTFWKKYKYYECKRCYNDYIEGDK